MNEIKKELGYFLALKAPLKYKFFYFWDRVINFLLSVSGNRDKIKNTYFLKGFYEIENKIGKFKIDASSDMNFIIKPHYEEDLYKYFDIDGGSFFDIGANIGKYTVYVGNRSKNVKVLAVEPNPVILNDFLLKNIESNGLSSRVKIFHVGFGDEKGEFNLKVPRHFPGSGSLVNESQDCDEYKIDVITLDDFVLTGNIDLHDIRLIKIDTEGFELKVLYGGNHFFEEIDNCRVIIESFLYGNEIKDFLDSKGFEFIKKCYGDNYIFEKGKV